MASPIGRRKFLATLGGAAKLGRSRRAAAGNAGVPVRTAVPLIERLEVIRGHLGFMDLSNLRHYAPPL